MDGATIFSLAFLSVGLLVILWKIATLFRRRAPPSDDPLDAVLLWWTKFDPFSVRDLLNSVLIMGRTGSGKSSSSARAIAKAIVGYKKSGGLILAAKPEDVGLWKEIFKLAGREADLIVFAPSEKWCLNCVEYILKSGGSPKDVTKFLMCVGETLRSSDTDGREDASFWQQQQERLLYLAVVVLWVAQRKVTVPDIQKFINNAAMNAADVNSDAWKKRFQNQTLWEAVNAEKNSIEAFDIQLAIDYWLEEFPNMADRTRSSILTGVQGILHTYNSGHARTLLSTETNVSPDDALTGKWIIVNMAPSEWGDTGCLVNAAWKYLMQKKVLRREAKAGDYINIIFADEAHQFINSMDSFYLAQCRSHYGCMVYITQSISSVYGAMGEAKGKHAAETLCANFTLCIVHACDAVTAEWASAKMGKTLQVFVGTSTPPQESMFEDLIGYGRITFSTSEQYSPEIQGGLLMNGLRTGGKKAGYECDGVVMRSGEPFVQNGKNFLFIAFSQK